MPDNKILGYVVSLLEFLKSRNKPVLRFQWVLEGPSCRVYSIGGTLMLKQMKVTEKLPLGVRVLDVLGNPTKVEGVPTWTISDPGLGALQMAADGLTGYFVASGLAGLCQVGVEHPGVQPDSIDIQIEPAGAFSFQIVAGTPEPK
jgi:hypothetical protein